MGNALHRRPTAAAGGRPPHTSAAPRSAPPAVLLGRLPGCDARAFAGCEGPWDCEQACRSRLGIGSDDVEPVQALLFGSPYGEGATLAECLEGLPKHLPQLLVTGASRRAQEARLASCGGAAAAGPAEVRSHARSCALCDRSLAVCLAGGMASGPQPELLTSAPGVTPPGAWFAGLLLCRPPGAGSGAAGGAGLVGAGMAARGERGKGPVLLGLRAEGDPVMQMEDGGWVGEAMAWGCSHASCTACMLVGAAAASPAPVGPAWPAERACMLPPPALPCRAGRGVFHLRGARLADGSDGSAALAEQAQCSERLGVWAAAAADAGATYAGMPASAAAATLQAFYDAVSDVGPLAYAEDPAALAATLAAAARPGMQLCAQALVLRRDGAQE